MLEKHGLIYRHRFFPADHRNPGQQTLHLGGNGSGRPPALGDPDADDLPEPEVIPAGEEEGNTVADALRAAGAATPNPEDDKA